MTIETSKIPEKIQSQQNENIQTTQEASNWYGWKGLVWIFVLTLLVTGLVMSASLFFIDFMANKEAPQGVKKSKIDYFGGPIPEKVTINRIKYTLINDYIKWVPVIYHHKDFGTIDIITSQFV